MLIHKLNANKQEEPVTDDDFAGGGGGGGSGGTDSDGNPLPSGFDYLAETYAYDGSGNVQTIAKTSGANTYTQTLTYTDGQLTGISKWVKS